MTNVETRSTHAELLELLTRQASAARSAAEVANHVLPIEDEHVIPRVHADVARPVHCVSETEIALLRLRDHARSVFLQHESFAHQICGGGFDFRDVVRVAAVPFLQ